MVWLLLPDYFIHWEITCRILILVLATLEGRFLEGMRYGVCFAPFFSKNQWQKDGWLQRIGGWPWSELLQWGYPDSSQLRWRQGLVAVAGMLFISSGWFTLGLLELSPSPVKLHWEKVLACSKTPQEVWTDILHLVEDLQGEARVKGPFDDHIQVVDSEADIDELSPIRLAIPTASKDTSAPVSSIN